VLEIRNLTTSYSGLVALSKVSIDLAVHDFVSVIGPNGAGKTTLFKTISGAVEPDAGSIKLLGQELRSVRPCDRPHLGIAHVPEGRQVFATMSVLENLEMGALTARGQQAWKDSLELIFSTFPILAERRYQPAGTLSGGEQQMLAIGRGLASKPKLLMLDEPSMGLAPAVVEQIFERIRDIHRDTDISILLVEQRVMEAMQLCRHGYVLEGGRITLQGSYDVLSQDDGIRRAYLGL
jgi:branched-chain amino acid transport system ATP-binding protein